MGPDDSNFGNCRFLIRRLDKRWMWVQGSPDASFTSKLPNKRHSRDRYSPFRVPLPANFSAAFFGDGSWLLRMPRSTVAILGSKVVECPCRKKTGFLSPPSP